jgi:integrase
VATVFKRGGVGNWLASWYDHGGKRRERSTRTTDRRTADRLAGKWEGDSMLRKEGVIDPRIDRFGVHEARALADHLDDWESAMLAKGNTPRGVAMVKGRAVRVAALAKADRISLLTPSAVLAAIDAVRDGDDDHDPVGLQTAHHYIRAIKGFSRWLARDGRTAVDALAHLAGFNAATDRRYERRAFDGDELARLIDAAASGPVVLGMGGTDRAAAYRIAAGTGFRAAEVSSLTRESFDLDADPPTITVRAGYSKNRQTAVQPIRADLAETLRPWLKGKAAKARVCPLPARAAEMLRADFRRARAKWLRETRAQWLRDGRRRPVWRPLRKSRFLTPHDEAGRVADFHAFRHDYITRVVQSGASVKVAQELARHSTPVLTIGRYAKARLHDLRQALDGLPGADSPPKRERPALLATGTDDAHPQHWPQHSERPNSLTAAPGRDGGLTIAGSADAQKAAITGDNRAAALTGAAEERSVPGATRTPDLRFRRPLLYPAELPGRRGPARPRGRRV